MKNVIRSVSLEFLALLIFSLSAGAAAVPATEKLLPDDTLALLTTPDYAKARTAFGESAGFQLWRDPSMKPFTEKLANKLKNEFVEPLERELGVKFADYAELWQGQFTLAVVQNGWQGRDDKLPAWLLLMDSKDRSSQLKTNLADLKKKWADAGKKMKSDKIRDVEFTTLFISSDDLNKTLEKSLGDAKGKTTPATPDADDKKPARISEVIIGQSDSLFIAGSDPKVIEKILIRQTGGSVPALAEQPAFDADYQARFRNALVYGWIHFKPLADVLTHWAAETGAKQENEGALTPSPTKVVSATGITGVKAISFSLNQTAEGSFIDLSLDLPVANRSGLFKMISGEGKDANPPPFVPADAVRFQRVRLDWQKVWAAVESTLVEISPQFGGVAKLMFDTAGKDKDPNFDLRKDLIGNLGDDLISFDKSPRGNTLAELNSPPALYLMGSPNADKLSGALKMIASLLPSPLNEFKEREFLGRKIYSLTLPPMPAADGSSSGTRALSYAASAGYVVLSTDNATLEGFLRSNESGGKALREAPGLSEAAQKVGGMSTGLFGYENVSETMRAAFDVYKNDPDAIQRMVAMTPASALLKGKDGSGSLKDWLDLSLLPSFDKIAKYFYFTVYAGTANNDSVSVKIFSPTPPQLKK